MKAPACAVVMDATARRWLSVDSAEAPRLENGRLDELRDERVIYLVLRACIAAVPRAVAHSCPGF